MHKLLAILVAIAVAMTALATLSIVVFLAILACAALPNHSLNSCPPPMPASNIPPPPGPANNTPQTATPNTANPRDGSQTSDDCVPDEWLPLHEEDRRASAPLLGGNTKNYATMSTQGIHGNHTLSRSAHASAPLACSGPPIRDFDDEI
ncbi:hypothetical protein N7G274_001410 [Stereocaulon virgatum]|uniref:Uncharacterized protein n=1 Tax=Stereocaulon virgatum TaxID=373712 RepID=A0ABR4ARW5_9LECA